MMSKSYYLTVEVKSDHVENGLGYMIAFCLPDGIPSPVDMTEFETWQEEVRAIVLRVGDQCLHQDLYTKKLALTGMMQDLAELNTRYEIQTGFMQDTPAVQIYSSNPFDNSIEIDFVDHNGHYKINETGLSDTHHAVTVKHGRTGLTDITRRHFPFQKSAVKKTPDAQPALKPPQP